MPVVWTVLIAFFKYSSQNLKNEKKSINNNLNVKILASLNNNERLISGKTTLLLYTYKIQNPKNPKKISIKKIEISNCGIIIIFILQILNRYNP